MPWAPDYVTLTELKDYLRIGDVDDDPELSPAIAAASRAVDAHCKRQFGVTLKETRHYTAEWDRRASRWQVIIDDVQTTTDLLVQVGSIPFPDGIITSTNFTLEPVNADHKGYPWTMIVVKPESPVKPTATRNDLVIDARWGWTAVPAAIKQATLLQAARFFSRRTSPYGVAGSPELGSELRLLARVDPDVAVSLVPYVRWWAAA